MDPTAPSAPSLISSLEAMIQASVTTLLDRRLGPPAADTLDIQIQTAVSAALDKRLGPAVGSLGNRMTSLVEQRLGSAVGTLNFRVETAVTAAMEQRMGPVGSALTAQITFAAAPVPGLPDAVPVKARGLDAVQRTETGGNQGIGSGALTEKEQLTQKRDQENRKPLTQERPAQKQSPVRQTLDTERTEKEQPAEKQNAAGSRVSKTTPSELGDELSFSPGLSAESNKSTNEETTATQSGVSQGVLDRLVVDGQSKSKASASVVITAKPNAKTAKPSSSAGNTALKRQANHKDEGNRADDADESESSSYEEEEDTEKPKRKRAKVKLDPPGYTNGPSIKFRRVSPKLTACAKSRGYPRVIDLKGFMEASNKQNLTMADVVATVLFNYDPLSLYAFMDMDKYPTFNFVRKEIDRNARNFVIERRREAYGVVVRCGYHLSQADRVKYRSDAGRIWETKYEYIILPVGRWVASNYMQDPVISNSSKRTIEQWATEFGTEVFLAKSWVEGPGVKIESDKLMLP